MKKLFLLFAIAGFLCTGTVYATNITIPDLNSSSGVWYGTEENDEVEPGMATGQQWDLEGFFLNGTKLSIVGGYNFQEGVNGILSGDIFIDVTGNAVYGGTGDIGGNNGNYSVLNTYGYDYVLVLDWTTNTNNPTYDVYAIDDATWVQTTYYAQNQGSSPWRYDSDADGNKDNPIIHEDVPFEYNPGTTSYNNEFGANDTHNELIVDLGFLLDGLDEVGFIVHYTMGCGNDNLMGQVPIPNPEPATMLLLGFGLIGIAGLYRKKQK